MICALLDGFQSSEIEEREFYHKFDGVEEALVELGVLEIVLWIVCAVHHPT